MKKLKVNDIIMFSKVRGIFLEVGDCWVITGIFNDSFYVMFYSKYFDCVINTRYYYFDDIAYEKIGRA